MADNILLAYAEPKTGYTLAASTPQGVVYLGAGSSMVWMPNGEAELFSTLKGDDKDAVAFVSKIYTSSPELSFISSPIAPADFDSLSTWVKGLLTNITKRFSYLLGVDLKLAVYPISGNVAGRTVIGENVRFEFSYKDPAGEAHSGISEWIKAGGTAVAFTIMLWKNQASGGKVYALLTHYIPDGSSAKDVMDAVPIPTPAWSSNGWSGAFAVLLYKEPPNSSSVSITAVDFGIPESGMTQRFQDSPNTYRIGLKPISTIQNIAARDITPDGSRAVTKEYETEKLVFKGEAEYALTVCEPGEICANAFIA